MAKKQDITIKETLTEHIWVGGFFLAIAGAVASYVRFVYTGAFYVFLIQVSLATLSVTFFFIRRRFSINTRAVVAIFMFYGVGTAALVEYGFYSAGLVWVMVATLFLGIFYPRIIRVAFVLVITFCLFIAYGFVTGALSPPPARGDYIKMPELWFSVVFIPVVFCFVFASAMKQFYRNLEYLNRQLEIKNQEVEYYANHDNLTGLPSLRLANDRLDMAIALAKRQDSKTALIYIDLDGFKSINDHYGHDVGDAVLVETASRLVSCVRETDTSCRIGGDEFLIIIPDIKDSAVLSQLCSYLIEQINLSIEVEQHVLSVSASLGVAMYPDNAVDADSLKKSADAAMYKVKESGKQDFLFADLIELAT